MITCLPARRPNDISRTDRAVRQAFESALKLMIQSLCVGGMVLFRSIDDRELANELRGAALTTALDLGKW